jgi:hypothetical protein
MGMHTMDIIRRDAARNRISSTVRPLDKEETKVEVILSEDRNYLRTQVVYHIDLEKDLIESISFSSGNGIGKNREGTLRFSYPEKPSTSEKKPPAVPDTGTLASQPPAREGFWILDLAKDTFN